MIERICEVCREPIKGEDQWFRVRQEYVHLSCAEKFFGEATASKDRSTNACAGHWRLILCQVRCDRIFQFVTHISFELYCADFFYAGDAGDCRRDALVLGVVGI